MAIVTFSVVNLDGERALVAQIHHKGCYLKKLDDAAPGVETDDLEVYRDSQIVLSIAAVITAFLGLTLALDSRVGNVDVFGISLAVSGLMALNQALRNVRTEKSTIKSVTGST